MPLLHEVSALVSTITIVHSGSEGKQRKGLQKQQEPKENVSSSHAGKQRGDKKD